MQMTYFPEVVQVVPFPDHTVSVYFSDGKIVAYDVKPLLDKGVFRALRDMEVFMNRCGIMNARWPGMSRAMGIPRFASTSTPKHCMDWKRLRIAFQRHKRYS